MAFVAPALAAIGGGSVAVGAMTAASAAVSAYSAVQASKTPKVQIPKPEAPPQAAKAPERTSMLAANLAAAARGGAQSGNSGTFLTGPAGVESTKLNLGKNSLLGQ